MPAPGPPRPALLLRYGHKIRLCTVSTYAPSSKPSEPWLGIGYYEKNGRHGILNCVPPLGGHLDALFNEDEYAVLDPMGKHNPGDVVEYGHPLVLVNQHGMVWNNKTGGITGYIGPRPRNIPGEIFVSFHRGTMKAGRGDRRDSTDSGRGSGNDPRTKSMSNKPSRSSSTTDRDSVDTTGGVSEAGDERNSIEHGGPVCYGDEQVAICVVDSNRRHSTKFHKYVTNFKKPSSRIIGGYLCCDGKGASIYFTIFPANPKIERISMFRKCITRYAFGNKIALPAEALGTTRRGNGALADIHFKLSNDATATLTTDTLHTEMLRHARTQHREDAPETVFAVPVADGPGELVVKLMGIVPQRAIAKLSMAKNRAENPAGADDDTEIETKVHAHLQPKPTLLQIIGAIVRKMPLPVFTLVYALLIHVLLTRQGVVSSTVPRELVVSMLVLLPLLFLAIKLDHPLSALFHAPEAAQEAEDEPGQGLKLIICEYRFRPGAAAASSPGLSPIRKSTPSETPNAWTTTPSTSESESTTVVDVPPRYVNAEKGDLEKGRARYKVTMDWRKAEGIDYILSKPWPHYRMIKKHYPHFYYKRGKQNEPVYYEKPGQLDFKSAHEDNLTVDILLRNYLVSSEFLWQVLEQDDNKKCISVVDIEGFGLSDCFGEPLEFVRKCSAISGLHYPERCAYIIVLNVPSWFSVVWKAVQPLIDEVTRQKITLVRSGSMKRILEALQEKIPIENIPEEYGGSSVGQSPEEALLDQLMAYLNHEDGAPTTNPIAKYMPPNHPALVGHHQ